MTTTRLDDIKSSSSYNESDDIYKILVREELDIASRYQFLKKFRGTEEGRQVLTSALDYAKEVKNHAIISAKKDGTTVNTKIRNRVITDLEDNIRMANIALAHPRLFSKGDVQHVMIDNSPVIHTRKY